MTWNPKTISCKNLILILIGQICIFATISGCARHSEILQRSVFFVGGSYVGESGKELMKGQMYVEELTPINKTQRYPIVLFSGAAQTAVNWMTTPDGRKGWAEYFVENGFTVYMIDQPARGRSACYPKLHGEIDYFTAGEIEWLFSNTVEKGNWVQAKKHTQWPGDGQNRGKKGDRVFDQFYKPSSTARERCGNRRVGSVCWCKTIGPNWTFDSVNTLSGRIFRVANRGHSP